MIVRMNKQLSAERITLSVQMNDCLFAQKIIHLDSLQKKSYFSYASLQALHISYCKIYTQQETHWQ